LTPEYKNKGEGHNPRPSPYFDCTEFFACLEQSLQPRWVVFPAFVLRAEILEVVLGLLLGVFGPALRVRAGIL